MYRAARAAASSGTNDVARERSQGRTGGAWRGRPRRGAAARSRHSRPRPCRRRRARQGQSAAQSAGRRRRVSRSSPPRTLAQVLRHRRRRPAAGAVSRRGHLGDRRRQDFHAAVGRPASGKLGSGGARQSRPARASWCRPARCIGLDAVRAAAEGTIHSVTMITRKPPNGLEGAPYLVERGISLKDLKEPQKIFDGTRARRRARLSRPTSMSPPR